MSKGAGGLDTHHTGCHVNNASAVSPLQHVSTLSQPLLDMAKELITLMGFTGCLT